MVCQSYYDESNMYEVGIDEAGRGPMFGRVYAAAAVLPKSDSFRHDLMKDSKKFTSKRKIKECSDYIKENATAYSIQYAEASLIDQINIREATLQCMHKAAKYVVEDLNCLDDILIMVDGNDFKPYMHFSETYVNIPHVTIKGGDNLYSNIAAASILAKVARDEYIDSLCIEYPFLDDIYGIYSNKGYGTKKHMDGIKTYGVTILHRKSYGICKNAPLNENYRI